MENKYFYISENGEQVGPLRLDEMRYHKIFPDTKVWCEGMSDWRSAVDIAELAFLFSENQAPLFHQYAPGDSVDSTLPHEPFSQKPKSYLIWAILATVFFCLPFGIAGIVYAARVDSYWVQGHYDAAYDASRKARRYTIISVLCAVVPYVLLLLLFLIMYQVQ